MSIQREQLGTGGTYQVECLTIWFNFMFFHIFDKAAVGVPRKQRKCDISIYTHHQYCKAFLIATKHSNKNHLVSTANGLIRKTNTTTNTGNCLKIIQTLQKCISPSHTCKNTSYPHKKHTLNPQAYSKLSLGFKLPFSNSTTILLHSVYFSCY